MKSSPLSASAQEFPEPERYELHEGPAYHFELTRREFVQVLGTGVLISVALPAPSVLGQERPSRGGRSRSPGVAERLHIGADGRFTVLTGKVEVGQGSRTQITMAAAEELGVPIDRVELVMADSAVVPDDGGTAGSRTTPSTIPAVRKGCAAARQWLLEVAAQTFGLDVGTLSVRDGQVMGLKPDQHFSYADLAAGEHAESLQKAEGSEVTLTAVSEWRVLGTPVARVGGREIVTGRHRYPSDIQRPGMLYGKILRPTTYGAELTDIDLGPARALADVTAVRDGDFVGFAAPTSRQAEEARTAAAATASWKSKKQPSSEQLYDYLRAHASDGRPRRDVKGSPEKAFQSADKTLRATYHIAYIQHAPMEPRAAVAEWNEDQLTVWTGTQQPSRVREDLARAFRLARENVRVIVPDTGGGFGGKHSGEVAVEAARLARAAGAPVSVRWSREEEFTWAYFRPAGVIDVAGALDAKQTLMGWEHVNFNSGASAIATPYDISHSVTEFKSCDAPLRSGSYRALASTANAFARESFMDELAAAAGMNPLEFRLRHLPEGRLRDVLVAATQRFDWKNKWKPSATPQSVGYGLACGTEKGSYVATCAKIQVDAQAGAFKVLEVCEAFECGAIQNPQNLKAQVEGCIIQGLGGALREETRFHDGRIMNAKFSEYSVPRFADVPAIETILLNRPDLPSVGAGETPIIGIAPAVANALFHATQTRIRSLPIRNETFRA